ncbi:MAG TPA: ATP synthase subunit C [Conexivisphaerales archaeon]|nr:ATP synthase subunit C [Conexivisphaerales archaeon]
MLAQKNMKFVALLSLLLLAGALFAVPAHAQTTGSFDKSANYLSAALAFAGSAIAAGWAISKAGSAGLAGSAERPEIRTTAIIISALGEALAIYGIVVALLILGKA